MASLTSGWGALSSFWAHVDNLPLSWLTVWHMVIPSMEQTPTQRLATLKLERDVREWVAERRASPGEPSFRAIATELRTLTGVDVTDQTVRLWCLAPSTNTKET